MKLFIFVIFLISTTLCFQCKSNKKTVSNPSSFISKNIHYSTIKSVIVNPNLNKETIAKEIVINNVELIDSIISIQYKCNCTNNSDLELVWDGKFLKSFPPRATLYIVSKSLGSFEKNEKSMSLTYYISPVKYPNSKTVIIQIQGFKNSINYNY
jgi:hypothetical protein